MKRPVHICSFTSIDDPTRGPYAEFRKKVLEAGRFSTFEAQESQAVARRFSELRLDPTLVLTPLPFPWTEVKKARPSDTHTVDDPHFAIDNKPLRRNTSRTRRKQVRRR